MSKVKKAADVAKKAVEKLGGTYAERMARAADTGFDTDVFHGTADDIPAFSVSERGKNTGAKSAHGAFWFVDNPEVAGGYARMAAEDAPVQRLIQDSYAAERRRDFDTSEALMRQAEQLEQGGTLVGGGGQNVMPLKIKGRNLMEIDADGATMSDLDDSQLSRWVNDAKEKGYDGLKISNFSDNADYGNYTPATHYAIFDPKNIRSINADFNPANANSADLLAGIQSAAPIGAAALLGGAALAPEDAEASIQREQYRRDASEAYQAAQDFAQRRLGKSAYWKQRRDDLLNMVEQTGSAALRALDMPLQGYMGLSAVAGSLASGNGINEALQQGGRIAAQPTDQTAYQYGQAVTDRLTPHVPPEAAATVGALVNAGALFGSPL